jgi:DNA-binding transcriptional MerR regulator
VHFIGRQNDLLYSTRFGRLCGASVFVVRRLLPRPIRISGQRRYDDTVPQRLAIIRFAKYVGFNLTEISRLLQGALVRPPTDRWRRMAHDRIQELDGTIQHATC